MFNFFKSLMAAQGDTGALENNLSNFGAQLKSLLDTIWPWLLGIGLACIALWGMYIGVRMIKAHKAEEKQEAKALIKQLIIGILVIFVIAAGLPMIISGIASWAGVSITKLS